MALPDALERRELLYGRPRRQPDYAKLGERYLEAGRRSDALEAFWRLEDAEERQARIRSLKDEAVKEGGAFLLTRIATRDPVTADEWREASEKAEADGKLRYALAAARQAGDAARVKALEGSLGLGTPDEEDEEAPPAAATEGAESE